MLGYLHCSSSGQLSGLNLFFSAICHRSIQSFNKGQRYTPKVLTTNSQSLQLCGISVILVFIITIFFLYPTTHWKQYNSIYELTIVCTVFFAIIDAIVLTVYTLNHFFVLFGKYIFSIFSKYSFICFSYNSYFNFSLFFGIRVFLISI